MTLDSYDPELVILGWLDESVRAAAAKYALIMSS